MKTCEFCGSEVSNKKSLDRHMKTTKYCLMIQKEKGLVIDEQYHTCECGFACTIKSSFIRHRKKCNSKEPQRTTTRELLESHICCHCSKVFHNKYTYDSHFIVCNLKKINSELEEKNYKLEVELKVKEKELKLVKQEKIDDRKDIHRQENDGKNEKLYELEESGEENNIITTDIANYNLVLSDGTKFIVPIREDGYVNVTKLCKAKNKRFEHWKENKESQTLLKQYEEMTGNPVNLIIQTVRGRNGGIFVHPDIAIQIAQWCEPSFAIQISKWI